MIELTVVDEVGPGDRLSNLAFILPCFLLLKHRAELVKLLSWLLRLLTDPAKEASVEVEHLLALVDVGDKVGGLELCAV